MSTTFCGAVSKGVWSTAKDRTVAFIRSAMNRCFLGLIIESRVKRGSPRWCGMNICGNKVKVAAYQ